MLDIDNLLIAIKAKIEATAELSAIHGKTVLNRSIKMAKPYTCVSITRGSPVKMFGTGEIAKPIVIFDVYADTLATANALDKAIREAFNGTLTLTGQTNTYINRLGGFVRCEGNEAKTLVYRSSNEIEFWVQS